MESEILFSRAGGVGRVLLNRPKALNALTLEMSHALEDQLRDWAKDDGVRMVLVRAAGERAFSAGGDIRRLYEAGKSGSDYPYRFWADEYRLDALIKHYPKPYIALIDGIVMGGESVSLFTVPIGSSRSTPCSPCRRPASASFPTWAALFLPRCPGRIGLYLGLTGTRLKAADMFHAGIATHCVPRARLDVLEQALAADAADFDEVLAAFAEDPGPAPLTHERAEIDRLFGSENLAAIVSALAVDAGSFARRQAEALATRSPTALHLTFRQLREGAGLAFDDCLRMEWRMASRVPKELPDFYEGVRAAVIDKDNKPRWSPARLEDVDAAALDRFFAPSPHGELALY